MWAGDVWACIEKRCADSPMLFHQNDFHLRGVIAVEVALIPAVEAAGPAVVDGRLCESGQCRLEIALRCLERLGQHVGEQSGGLGEECVFRREVAVERGGGDAHEVGDLLEAHRVVSAVAELLCRDTQNQRSSVGGASTCLSVDVCRRVVSRGLTAHRSRVERERLCQRTNC